MTVGVCFFAVPASAPYLTIGPVRPVTTPTVIGPLTVHPRPTRALHGNTALTMATTATHTHALTRMHQPETENLNGKTAGIVVVIGDKREVKVRVVVARIRDSVIPCVHQYTLQWNAIR